MHIELAICGLEFLKQEKRCENGIHWIKLYCYQSQSEDIHSN